MIECILFDLDGTLLPMDQDEFVKAYFSGIARKLAPYGYTDANALIAGIWAGTSAMVSNDGSCTNEEAFWNRFSKLFGEGVRKDASIFYEFFCTDFQNVSKVCGYTSEAAKTVHAIKARGLRVVLATDPIFPAVATQSRIRWAGLKPEDFELYTTYENSSYCKPNPKYYQQILDEIGLKPEQCLMVGNDAVEDVAATKLGIPVYLLTKCLINKKNADLSQYPQGDFEDLLNYIDKIHKTG